MDKRDEELIALRKRVAELESNSAFAVRLSKVVRNHDRAMSNAVESAQNFRKIEEEHIYRGFGLLKMWLDWCELSTEDFVKTYGHHEDSMVFLANKTREYLNHPPGAYVKHQDAMNEVIWLVRNCIARVQVGEAVVFTVPLSITAQEAVVKAIDKMDTIRKELK